MISILKKSILTLVRLLPLQAVADTTASEFDEMFRGYEELFYKAEKVAVSDIATNAIKINLTCLNIIEDNHANKWDSEAGAYKPGDVTRSTAEQTRFMQIQRIKKFPTVDYVLVSINKYVNDQATKIVLRNDENSELSYHDRKPKISSNIPFEPYDTFDPYHLDLSLRKIFLKEDQKYHWMFRNEESYSILYGGDHRFSDGKKWHFLQYCLQDPPQN